MSRLSFAAFPFTHARTWVAGLAAVVLLSGCQGGSAPGLSPLGSISTTASPTLSVSAPAVSATATAPPVYKPADAHGKAQNVPVPVMPELAKENSKAGLEAFIRYWYAQLSYSYETGSTDQLKPLSSSTCALCASLRKSVESAWLDGRWITGATIKSATIEADFDPSTSTQVAVVQVIQEPIEIRVPGGTLYQDPTAATNSASRAALTFENQRWLLTDLGLIR
ncbi:DUF6318 family protein [Paenarthrobacter sp. MSM-2-10-13]|uniref:DUF6318 family protein n=1 Tax=Paenarthrobacter sp. MSM-2-10-13 TaxID=2717318 RepID=UPI001AA15550|nr:DUF6318 family protein [Paenarthrobacter sp. MSM-2-10-13]